MRTIGLLLVTGLLWTACDKNRIYEVNKTLADDQWAVKDTLLFDFAIQDTVSSYNFLYNIRYSGAYPYYNLYTRYYLLDSAYNEIESRQSNMDLFEPKTGKPYGGGMGDYYDYQILFLKDKTMPYAGRFYLKTIHYMRDEPLNGIASFGLKVSKSERH